MEEAKKSEKNSSSVSAKGTVGLIARLKKVKHIELILAGIAVAVMLLIYFGSCSGESRNVSQPPPTSEDRLQRFERQINEMLSSMEGAGETRVIINWESSVETIIAYITNNSPNSSSSAPQIITGGGVQSPIILREIYPAAIGVVILTQGGNDVRVKIEMINAVSTLLAITPDRIQILTMTS